MVAVVAFVEGQQIPVATNRRRAHLSVGGLRQDRLGLCEAVQRQVGGGPAERRQHLLLAGSLDLLARHHISCLRIDGLQSEHEVRAKAGDRSHEQRFELLPLGDLARH